MRKTLMLLAVAASWIVFSLPAQAEVSDAISLTNQAIVELTDPPGLGGRITVDPLRRWGADLGQINKATALLQDALDKARAGGASSTSIRLLEEAIAYGQAKEHKEARLSAQGALRGLCGASTGEGCDKAPKYGAYVAP